MPAVGDCIVGQSEGREYIGLLEFPDIVDCDDPDTAFEVLHVRREPSGQRCVDVPGATDAVAYSDGPVDALCLAEVGDDSFDTAEEYQRGICLVEAG